MKRKKRTIVPREKKRKNKRKKDENYIEFSDGENGEEVENEVAENEVAENEGVEENNGDDEWLERDKK